jgi:hypothetical protein
MIITPNIDIDNTHMNTFQDEFVTYENTPGEESTHYGSGDLEDCTVFVKKIRTLQGNGMYLVVSNKREAILICRLVAAPVPQGAFPWGRKIYVMDKILVHLDYAGSGLAPAVYTWLADNGYTVMSDSHQNSNSLAVWHKLGKRGGVFVVNIEEGTWRPYDPSKTEDWMLFGNNDPVRYWPIRFVLTAK